MDCVLNKNTKKSCIYFQEVCPSWCAHDTTVVTKQRIPEDYSNLEQYFLQLLKSVVMSIPHLEIRASWKMDTI